MRADREKALEFRRKGKSYSSISKELRIPLSTLSGWFKGLEWSKGVEHELRESARKGSITRMKTLNEERGKRLEREYERAVKEAREEFRSLRYDPLFVAGMTLYLQRGGKGIRGQIRFGSADPAILKIFLVFLGKCCSIPPDKVRAGVFAHPGLDAQTAARFWALSTGIPLSRFHKTMVVPGKHDAREFTYGSCALIVSSAYLKVKMEEWAALLPKQLIDTR